MRRAYTVAAIREAEAKLAAEVGERELMRRAATGLADIVASHVPEGATSVALVGPGNNGGDALFAAAMLAERGRRINLLLLDRDRAHSDGLAAALAAGACEVDSPEGHHWCIDGVFGIGARPGLAGVARQWRDWQEATKPFTIAVDTPSGMDVDGGTAQAALRADVTVTMGALKPGLVLGPGAESAGRVEVVDIGLALRAEPAVEAIEAADGQRYDLMPARDATKYARGVVGIAAGSAQYPGAAHLAVAGAQAGPAGMIRYRGPAELGDRVVDRAPEVVHSDGRVQAWVVGPGAGPDVGEYLRAALADSVPVVVDAGALDALPGNLSPEVVLTPHAGELAALLGVERVAIDADPLGHARRAAERWNATVLLKGRRTLVVSPGLPVRVNLSGTPWLATAGAGDVLAGLIGSMLAAGLAAREAASLGAFLHGAAAVRANPGGPVTAGDVAAALPSVVAAFVGGSLGEVNDW